jgi:hypothetical protein
MGCCWGTRKQKDELDIDIELQRPLLDDDSDVEQGAPLISVVVDSRKPEPKPPQTARVSLQLPGDSGLDSSDRLLPPVFYVIVGCGPAAVINHTTLIQTEFGRKRREDSPAGTIPILHVGFPNPWSKYFEHGMGQPPHLLSLPGFKPENQPCASDRTIDEGLNSRVFGACVDAEFEHCLKHETDRWALIPTKVSLFKDYQWPNLCGWAAWIDSRSAPTNPLPNLYNAESEGEPKRVWQAVIEALKEPYPNFPKDVAPYRLVVVDHDLNRCYVIYAQFIDVCTGSGRANVIALRPESKDYKMARTPPWCNPAKWSEWFGGRRILAGMDAIRSEVVWSAGERVCVTQGGGIGLNAAEKAERGKCWLDWFHTADLLQTFGNPRNYTFLKHWAEERPRRSGEQQTDTLTEAELIAHGTRVRLGKDATLKSVNADKDAIAVELQARPEAPDRRTGLLVPEGTPHIRDVSGVAIGMDSGAWLATETYVLSGGSRPSPLYHRVALPNGLFGDRLGQPFTFANHLTPTTPWNGPGGRMIAMGTADKAIRLLGAAAQTYPGFDVNTYKPRDVAGLASDSMWAFRLLLPVSAVPDGFILSGLNIAIANEFFAAPNCNLNTMTQGELETELTKLGASKPQELAKKIVDNRNKKNGYKNAADLATKLAIAESDLPVGLRFTY